MDAAAAAALHPTRFRTKKGTNSRARTLLGRAPRRRYYAIPLVHSPMQAPERVFEENAEALARFGNSNRRTFAAQTILLDASVGALVGALRAAGLRDDTLLVVASDNGGMPAADSAGSNWPLRGMKGYYFEGGVRTHALINSPLIPPAACGTT